MSGILYLDRGGHVHPHKSTQASLPPSMGFQPTPAAPAPSQPYGGPHGGGGPGWDKPDKPEPMPPGQTGGAAGSGLVPVTSTVPAGVGGGVGTVTTMVPVDQAPISAGGPGPGTGGISDVQDLFPILGEETPVIPEDDKTLSDKVKEVGSNLLGIFTGPEIKKLTPRQLAAATQLLSQYQALGITNPNKLRAIMANNIGGWLTGKDQTFSDEFGNIVNPDDVIEEDGKLIDKKTGNKVRYTKEGIMDLVGSDTLQSLQMHNPELYYPFAGMPQTSGGLEDLARMDAQKYLDKDSELYNPDFAQMIFDARQTIDQKTKYTGAGSYVGGEQGIVSAAPAEFLSSLPEDELEIIASNVPSATTPAATTTAAATTPTPHDYLQWPQFTSAYPGHYANLGPNYVNQGLGQWPQFNYWNQIANAFPGMRNYG